MARGNKEGTIYKRQDGRWSAQLTLPGGKRRTLYAKTREEVSRKLTAALRDREDGLPAPSERQSIAQFLNDWLETAKPTIRPSTHRRYEEYVRLHVLPALGRVRVSALTPQHLQKLYAQKLKDGLSPTSVAHLHAVLHRALSQGVRWGVVSRNVAQAVDPPRIQRKEFQALNAEQAKRLLGAARGDRLEALYVLALTTGMRQGELLGLRWQDVDLEMGALQVRVTLQRGGTLGEPKTDKARRQIILVEIAMDALGRHRNNQWQERIGAGAAWADHDLVFTNTLGGPVDANNLRKRSFPALLRRAGLPRIRFHDLRHSAATLLLSLGTNPKVVQEVLGHSQIGVTMDVYAHKLPTMQRDAMADLNRLLTS